MNHQDKMSQFRKKKEHQLGMGGEKKLKARREAGKLNVRERIDYFFDKGTFQEIGLFSHSSRVETAKRTPTDGKIIGFGQVRGRTVGIVANDMTILGASSAPTNSKKIEYMRSLSCEKGIPLVFLAESSGARIQEIQGSMGTGIHVAQNRLQYRRLREAPWISVLLGHIYGSSSWYAALSDVVIMQKGSVMAVSSPKVTLLATGENVSNEELGGWKIHADVTGLADVVGNTEQECMDLAKEALSYLPSNANETAPTFSVPQTADEDVNSILGNLPEQESKAYDMRSIINVITDNNNFYETKARFGKPCITGFARLGGQSVGIVANNPSFFAGALDADSCEKITSFIVLCDSYNIPIVSFVDTPGFMIGKDGEKRKMVGKILNWMNALSLVTVPILTVIIRKIYGQAYLNMCCGKYANIVAAWPTAEISFMGLEPAMNVVHNLKKKENPQEYERLIGDMAKDSEPWGAAGVFGVHEIIDPTDTRHFLIQMLELHQDHKTCGIGQHLMHNWPTTF